MIDKFLFICLMKEKSTDELFMNNILRTLLLFNHLIKLMRCYGLGEDLIVYFEFGSSLTNQVGCLCYFPRVLLEEILLSRPLVLDMDWY